MHDAIKTGTQKMKEVFRKNEKGFPTINYISQKDGRDQVKVRWTNDIYNEQFWQKMGEELRELARQNANEVRVIAIDVEELTSNRMQGIANFISGGLRGLQNSPLGAKI